MEVIYTGLHQTPEQIVETALQEDADAVGISILSGAHMTLVPRILEGLKAEGLENVLVVVGGTIPKPDIVALKEQGVAEIFTPGAPVSEIVEFLQAKVPSLVAVDVSLDGGIATVTVNRPDAMNAIDLEHATLLRDRAREARRRRGRCASSCSPARGRRRSSRARTSSTCATSTWPARRPGATSASAAASCSRRCRSRRSPRSTASRSAAAASLRSRAISGIASSTAKLGQPEVNLGVIPGWGGTQRLARTTTLGFAKDLCYTGRIVGADEALAHGLVDAVHPPEELMAKVRELCEVLVSKGPLALAAAQGSVQPGAPGRPRARTSRPRRGSSPSSSRRRTRPKGMTAFAEKRPANSRVASIGGSTREPLTGG